MELSHRFTVPTTVEETWAHFGDIAAVAECFPGAQVTSVEEGTFQGTVKVKLGPIALQYSGHGTFVEKDDAAHRFVVDAKGKDKRGNGTAGALVTLTMAPGADSATTDVEVLTDLAITGKPAQFGRGVMQDVSDKLLGQFVTCLETRLAAPEPEATASGAAGAAEAPPPEVASDAPPSGVAGEATPLGDQAAAAARASASRPAPSPPPADDAIDLGSTVLPVLIKSYGKQAAIGVVVLLALWWVIRRLG